MEINPHIFRSYDIRGIASNEEDGSDITPIKAELIGKGIGTYLKRNSGKRVVVGRDCRTTGETLMNALIDGLVSVGCEVTNVGMATSPMVYFAVVKKDFDGGIALTASHNPKEYNGFKVVKKNAEGVHGGALKEIFHMINDRMFDEEEGSTEVYQGLFEDYKGYFQTIFKAKRKLKVVIDAGNGMAGAFAPELFRSLGYDVTELFCEVDGTFPNHEANPEHPKNLKKLIKMMKEEDYDLGIGFDGDGDRVNVVDNKGRHYSSDFLLLFLAKDLLGRHPGSKVIFDIKTSQLVDKFIEKYGGQPIIWKTGHANIKEKMKMEGAMLAGEVSGHIFFVEDYYGFDDAMFAAARALQILSGEKASFNELMSEIPPIFTTPEIKLKCDDRDKFRIVEEVKNHFMEKYECLTIDGVRVLFDDNSWGLIRCSNTSPSIVLRFESDKKETFEKIQKEVTKVLRKYKEISLEGTDLAKFL